MGPYFLSYVAIRAFIDSTNAVEGLTLSQSSLIVLVGKSKTLTAISTSVSDTVTFSTSNAGIASVSIWGGASDAILSGIQYASARTLSVGDQEGTAYLTNSLTSAQVTSLINELASNRWVVGGVHILNGLGDIRL